MSEHVLLLQLLLLLLLLQRHTPHARLLPHSLATAAARAADAPPLVVATRDGHASAAAPALVATYLAGRGGAPVQGAVVWATASCPPCTFGAPPSTRLGVWAHVPSAQDRASASHWAATDAKRVVLHDEGNSGEMPKCT